MAYTTTRSERADRSRFMPACLAAAAVTTFGLAALSLPAVAQVKAPAKSHLKTAPHTAANPATAPSPTDNQADQLNAQWLKEHSDGTLTTPPTVTADSNTVPVSATLPGAGSRTLVNGSVKLVSAKAAAGFLPGGPNHSALQPLSDAFADRSATSESCRIHREKNGRMSDELLTCPSVAAAKEAE